MSWHLRHLKPWPNESKSFNSTLDSSHSRLARALKLNIITQDANTMVMEYSPSVKLTSFVFLYKLYKLSVFALTLQKTIPHF